MIFLQQRNLVTVNTIVVTSAAMPTTAHVVLTTTGTDASMGTTVTRTMTPYTALQLVETTAPTNICEQLPCHFYLALDRSDCSDFRGINDAFKFIGLGIVVAGESPTN